MSSAPAGDLIGPDRFRSLWRRCLIDGAKDESARVHQRLLDGYSEPQRRYHSLEHVGHCLAMFDQCKSLAKNPDALELAVWFHDAIFEPGKNDNEARSEDLYQQLSGGVHDAAMRALVGRMIMATLHDGTSLEDSDAQYMVDIDLSSFGSPWEAFLRDSENLRRENPRLEDSEYYENLSRFHQLLLQRDRIFRSDFFARRFETRARENISRFLELIDAGN